MDLLRIGDKLLNLDRLSVIEEIGEGTERSVILKLGDTTVSLDGQQSQLFRAFLTRHYCIRELTDKPPRRIGKGKIVPPDEPDC
jgi:hypothetical protein